MVVSSHSIFVPKALKKLRMTADLSKSIQVFMETDHFPQFRMIYGGKTNSKSSSRIKYQNWLNG